jgi:septal ring factor EnvC (AmiA/AmiB activator)
VVADPHGLDLGNWALELAMAAVVAVLGWAMAVLNRGRQLTERRLDDLEKETGAHETQLAVVQNCQINTERRLTEIKDVTRDTNEKLHELANTLTDVLLAIKTTKA